MAGIAKALVAGTTERLRPKSPEAEPSAVTETPEAVDKGIPEARSGAGVVGAGYVPMLGL